MGKHVLLINDLPGYGEVALAAMMPVLSRLGCHVYNLPTALVSNTLDYGKFSILETTDYMRETLAVWEALGFSFDAAAAGFLASEAQAELVASWFREKRKQGMLTFADPIMGDEGRLYNGVPPERTEAMRTLIAEADLICPNYTEAALLADVPYRAEGTDRRGMEDIMGALRRIGARSVVVTSARVDGRDAVAGWDARTGETFLLPFTPIPVRFPGTGDIFSAVLLGRVLRGEALPSAVQAAMDAVAALIKKNQNQREPFKGIPLETCLEVID